MSMLAGRTKKTYRKFTHDSAWDFKLVDLLEAAPAGTIVHVPRGRHRGYWIRVADDPMKHLEGFYCGMASGRIVHPSWLGSDLLIGDALEVFTKEEKAKCD